MRDRKTLTHVSFLLILILLTKVMHAQCIDKTVLWNRLLYFRNSTQISAVKQLAELKQYQLNLKNCHYKDSLWAFLIQRIGAAYFKLGDYKEAEIFTKQAISLIEDNQGNTDVSRIHLVKYYYALSVIYNAELNPDKTAQAQDSCIAIALQSRSIDQYILTPLLQRAESLFKEGDFHRSVQYAEQGETITSKVMHGGDSLRYAYNFLLWKVNSLYFLNNFDRTETIITKTIGEFQKSGISYYNGSLYERMAAIKTQKKEFSTAILFFNKSLAFDKKNKAYLGCAQTMINMGYYLYSKQLHDYNKARYCFFRAIFYIDQQASQASLTDLTELNLQATIAYENLGNIYVIQNKFDSAEYYFNKAFAQVILHYHNDDITFSFDAHNIQGNAAVYVLYSLLDEADGLLKKNSLNGDSISLQKASRIFLLADWLQSQIKRDQLDLNSRLFWRNYLQRLYENAIETNYLLNLPVQAFYYFEKSRAVLLSEQLNKQRAMDKEDISKLYQLREKIFHLTNAMNNPDSINQLSSFQNKLFESTQELNIVEQTIKQRNPIYFKSFLDTNKMQLRDVQNKILGNHTSLLEIFDGDKNVYTLLITEKTISLNKIDKKDFEKTTYDYTSFLSDPNLLNRRFNDFIQNSNHLFKLLIGNHPVSPGRLFISPDKHYFPFESLVTNIKFGYPVYFVNDYSVVYTYSADYLMNELANSNSTSIGNFLGLAPVQYPVSFNLAPLSGSDVSLHRISEHFEDGKSLISSKASKGNFMKLFYGYKIIQLYTHATDSGLNGEPAIYFSDSVLSLPELIPEKKPATKLIVLSACETGNGKLYKGEGVFSFNRGFAALGIPSSVINLWSVENESTYQITELFYKYTSGGAPLDIALQKAKLEFIRNSSKQKKLPYYWAAAILVGKTDAIEMSNHFNWMWIAIAGGLFIAVIFFALIKRKTSVS